ncbi:Nucleotide-binding universal stress protein, UspA family [Roseateles sp. YR242]|uniref:universal stress protein n=1 Tax=Roseateles sp. YR242 TaxID=1855305 RepID=UPI0008D6AD80|nr:universal stress protein [Roseateles sp. YR242]SEK36660.1 Nucleotide-binding universal stress protein, UspA family [Roseateles sp. YR242]
MNADAGGWRSIAVHVGRGAAAQRSINAALLLARWFDARVTGVIVSANAPDIETGTPSSLRWRSSMDAGSGDRATMHQRLRVQCDAAGVRCGDIAPCAGQTSAALVLASHAADLLVVTQPVVSPHGGPLTIDDLEVVLRLAARPLLILPATRRGPLSVQNVLIAWDGSGACARAVADALPLLRRAVEVQVVQLICREAVCTALTDWWPPLRDWLRRQGVAAQNRPVTLTTRPGLQLRRLAELLDPNLVVMGAYGQETWRAPWIGRTTRFMLETSPAPLLVSH